MGIRHSRALDLTVAMPLLCPFVGSEEEYFARKTFLQREMVAWAENRLPFDTAVYLNTLDAPGEGPGGTYLTLLGTSAEDSDSGQVGRGNRVSGFIPVSRPIGTEAFAGKNPFSHIGKIYSVLADRAAQAIGKEVEGVQEAEVLLVSRIGHVIDAPLLASLRLHLFPGVAFPTVSRRAEEVMERELAGVGDLCRRLAAGEEDLGVPR
jgi:S-adenosylmethionine synthetase